MKNQVCILVSALTLLGLLGVVSACKKTEAVPGLSAKIQAIVPQAALTDMKSKGLVINEGNTPPNVEGIIEAEPYTLLAPYSADDGWAKGKVITAYRFRLTGQNGDNVKVEEKQISGTTTGNGTASFLSGSGNKFSLFGEIVGTQSGIPNKSLVVISGEVTATGIKDFQYAFLFTEKTGDAGNTTLIPINKARIWIDGDALATKVSTFRRAVQDAPQAPGADVGSMGSR